jgi:hypothetical protein
MKILVIITTLTSLIFSDLSGQTKKIEFGFGSSLTVPFDNAYFPSIYSTPYINIKLQRHEILAGADFYFLGLTWDKEQYPLVIGGQTEYRYHFLKPDKKYNFFVNTNVQYVQFQFGCGAYARPYDFENKYICNDAVELKSKSIMNTYGIGVETNFLKRFYIYSVGGLGYSYSIVKGLYENSYRGGNLHSIRATLRVGLSFSIYKSTKDQKAV